MYFKFFQLCLGIYIIIFIFSCANNRHVIIGEYGIWKINKKKTSEQIIPFPSDEEIENLTKDSKIKGRLILCQNGVVRISKNYGKTWAASIFESNEEEGVDATFHPKQSQKIFLATNKQLLLSYDEGKSWSPISKSLSFEWRPKNIFISKVQPDYLFITTRGEGVYNSVDGGITWKNKSNGLPKGIGIAPFAPVESAVLDPQNPKIMYVALEAKGIYKTTDGGEKWFSINKGLPELIVYRTFPWQLEIHPTNSQTLLLWTSLPVNSNWIDTAFFITHDGGATWKKLSEAPDNIRIYDIQFVDSNLNNAIASTADSLFTILNN